MNQCLLIFHFLKKYLLHFYKKLWNITIYCISVSVIGIGRYEKYHIGILSVSADMKIGFIGDYRYRPIWKNPYRSYTELDSIHFSVAVLESIHFLLLNELESIHFCTFKKVQSGTPSKCHLGYGENEKLTIWFPFSM